MGGSVHGTISSDAIPPGLGGGGNTVLHGTGAPGGGVGEDGDFYIDTAADAIYGPKAGGAWGSPTSLVGLQGPQGPAGADGADGAQGPAGADGADGAPGAQGEQGIQGIQGIQGPAGADGAAGAAGLGFTAIAYKSADQTLIGASYADVTSLSLPVLANKAYAFEFEIWADADATTTGIDVAVTGPASPTAIRYEQVYWTSATARTERAATAYDANTASTASNGTAPKPFRVRGVLINGANAGNIVARIKRENVGTGPNVRAGSWGRLSLLN